MPAAIEDQAAIVPDIKEWKIGLGTNERVYEQSTLSIAGEIRIVQLAVEVALKLDKNGFPWGELEKVADEEGNWNWRKVSELFLMAASVVPDVIVDTTCIAFGLSATNDDGSRDKTFDDDRQFLKKNLNMPVFFDIVQTFLAQNDYERLVRPFGLTLTRAIGTRVAEQKQSDDSPEPSTSS